MQLQEILCSIASFLVKKSKQNLYILCRMFSRDIAQHYTQKLKKKREEKCEEKWQKKHMGGIDHDDMKSSS